MTLKCDADSESYLKYEDFGTNLDVFRLTF